MHLSHSHPWMCLFIQTFIFLSVYFSLEQTISCSRSETHHSYKFNPNIGNKHGFSCINIRQVPWEVLKTEAEGRSFQHLPRDLANVNALKNDVRLLLLHKNWKHLLLFALFLALFCFAFSPMSRERYFHGLCLFWGRAVHIS